MAAIKMPYILHIPKVVTLVVDRMKPNQLEQAWDIFSTTARQGMGGIGVDEMPSSEHLRKHLFEESLSYSLMEENRGKMAGLMSVIPSPIVRSTSPFLHGGYIVLDHVYHGRGIGHEVYLLATRLGKSLGYEGLVGRSSMKNTSHNMAVRHKFQEKLIYTGAVPDSTYLAGKGYMDDLVYLHDYGRLNEKIAQAAISSKPTFRKGLESGPVRQLWDLSYSSISVKLPNTSQVLIESPSTAEEQLAEELIRSVSKKGDGFGLDEFLADESYNRKLFKSSASLVAKIKDQVVGTAVLGPCGLCKSSMPKFISLCVAVDESHRHKGIGRALGTSCFSVAKDAGFGGIMLDVLMSNTKGIYLAHSMGMMPIGTIPYSCFVQNKGFIDSMIFVKKFQN